MAAEGKPVKGILKHTSSLDKHDNPSAHSHDGKRHGMKWDEMNILATHHPPDKDYGHMKIDEPPTPYSKYSDPEDEDGEGERRGSIGKSGDLDPSLIVAKLEESQEEELSGKVTSRKDDSDDEDDDIKYETLQEREHRQAFELKRKIHYNEYQAVQLAKKLMAEEEDEDDEDEEDEKAPVAMESNAEETKHQSGQSANLAD